MCRDFLFSDRATSVAGFCGRAPGGQTTTFHHESYSVTELLLIRILCDLYVVYMVSSTVDLSMAETKQAQEKTPKDYIENFCHHSHPSLLFHSFINFY